MVGEFKTVRKGHEMTNRKMFFTMLWGAVFRRRSRAVMAVIASMVGAATLFCLAATCIAVPQQMNEEMRAYGANLIVTPSESAEKSHGIDTDTGCADRGTRGIRFRHYDASDGVCAGVCVVDAYRADRLVLVDPFDSGT